MILGHKFGDTIGLKPSRWWNILDWLEYWRFKRKFRNVKVGYNSKSWKVRYGGYIEMSHREKLIQELKGVCKTEMLDKDGLPYSDYIWAEDKIADFILNDRKIVIYPLVSLGQIKRQPLPSYEDLCQAIEETLNRAGVGGSK